jgi:putative hydrolase
VTDNIFDRLRELLESSPGPVNWNLAREIAASSAGEAEPIEPWIAEEFEELSHTAAIRIAAVSPLDAGAVTARVEVLDRRAWASRATEGLAYLAEPLSTRMGAGGTGGLGALLQPLAPALMGMQMGSMASSLSQRVLANFDVGLPLGPGAGAVFVVPNVEAFAADHGLDPRQTRLWVALHEVAHASQLQVPWMWEHVEGVIADFIAGLELDPAALEERIGSFDDPESLQRMMEDPSGLSGLLGGPGSAATLPEIQALMSVLEGYAGWLIDRAAPGMIPEAPRLTEAIDRRRAEPSQGEQMLQQVIGLDLEHHRYRDGAAFCEEVSRRWGDEALTRLWESAQTLPTLEELADPLGWAARVLL